MHDFDLNPPATASIEVFDFGRDVYGNPTSHFLILWSNGSPMLPGSPSTAPGSPVPRLPMLPALPVRDGVPLSMTRAWLRDRIAEIRDNLESSAEAERGEYEAARAEAVEALDTLPRPPRHANPDYLQRAESLRSAWREGYAEGSL